MTQNLQRPRSKLSWIRRPDRYKFADAACIARQAQGRADASCDFKWHARIYVSIVKRHGRRKHLKSSIRTPRSAGKFISVGAFFSLVRFFSSAGKKRNEHGAPKARHPAQRDSRVSGHPAKQDKLMSHYHASSPFREAKINRNKKIPHIVCGIFFISSFLSSRAASGQVLSAFMSLTTVFGMGTGVSS